MTAEAAPNSDVIVGEFLAIKIVPFLRVTPGKLRPASVGAPKKLDGSRDDPRKLQI